MCACAIRETILSLWAPALISVLFNGWTVHSRGNTFKEQRVSPVATHCFIRDNPLQLIIIKVTIDVAHRPRLLFYSVDFILHAIPSFLRQHVFFCVSVSQKWINFSGVSPIIALASSPSHYGLCCSRLLHDCLYVRLFLCLAWRCFQSPRHHFREIVAVWMWNWYLYSICCWLSFMPWLIFD